uniref:DUF7504 family protein n=1 Tax=Halorussus ruber TaxID=1126238 RepID=UPI001B2FF9A0|nr:hypothetical protein [Halorussus ruber]
MPPEVFDVLARPAETNLLVVSYRDGPDEWLQNCRQHVGELPAEVGFVNVGEMTRSASASLSASGGPSRSPTPADALPLAATVEDPADLTAVGVRASEYLETWDCNGNRTVVVLDSVTGLLEAVSLDRAFEFLHLLAGRVESVDGRIYFLLHPEAHDDRSLSIVRELADAAVGLGDPR